MLYASQMNFVYHLQLSKLLIRLTHARTLTHRCGSQKLQLVGAKTIRRHSGTRCSV
jgi:hypothetical protein